MRERAQMMKTRLRIFLSCFALLSIISGCDRSTPAASPRSKSENPTDRRLKALEDLSPSQSHMMADVGDHFANLWFAGRAQNWPLADFYLGETKSHLRWSVRRIPIRKDKQGHDVNLGNILEAFENSQLADLKRALESRDPAAFEKSYKESLTMCYSCHKAADKPYLRPQVPVEAASRIINFDPKAKWPL